MKNLVRVVALAAAVSLPALASAQDKQFNVGTKVLNVGLLVGDEVLGGIGVGGGLEVGIKDIAGQVRLGVGGAVNILRNDYGQTVAIGGFRSSSTNTVFQILGFVNGHYQLEQVPALDLYAGPVIGFSRYSISYEATAGGGTVSSTETSGTDAAVGIQAGARYEFAPRVSGQLQLSGGSNLPFLNVGLAFKF